MNGPSTACAIRKYNLTGFNKLNKKDEAERGEATGLCGQLEEVRTTNRLLKHESTELLMVLTTTKSLSVKKYL